MRKFTSFDCPSSENNIHCLQQRLAPRFGKKLGPRSDSRCSSFLALCVEVSCIDSSYFCSNHWRHCHLHWTDLLCSGESRLGSLWSLHFVLQNDGLSTTEILHEKISMASHWVPYFCPSTNSSADLIEGSPSL